MGVPSLEILVFDTPHRAHAAKILFPEKKMQNTTNVLRTTLFKIPTLAGH